MNQDHAVSRDTIPVDLREGAPCPKCTKPLVVKPGMFFWRGRFFSGCVCESCNALFDNADDSFCAHVLGITPTQDDANRGAP